MAGFSDLNSSARMRDVIERIAKKVVNKERPDVKIGRVHHYSSGKQVAWIQLTGESDDNLIKVRIALNMLPTKTIESDGDEADIVRVAGKPGQYWVTDYIRGVPQSPDNIPIGAGFLWFHSTIPDGYLALQGQTVNTADYPDLASVWGQTGSTMTECRNEHANTM